MQGEGSHTGPLFADVAELYLTHEEKPDASHYPLNYVWYYDAYVNGEPGTEEIEDDPEHELAGERLVDYDIWLEIVELSDDFWLGYNGEWYTEGDHVHLSNVEWHHLHFDYWMYASVYDENEVIYVVFRLHDELDDGQRYDASEEFWVVFNRPVPGDFNKDGYIDGDDYAHLHPAITGPDTIQGDPQYQDADLDGDEDIDLADFALFQRCYRGSEDHPDPRCAN